MLMNFVQPFSSAVCCALANLLAHGVAKALRGRGSSYGSRLATFWAVFSAAPAFLFNGLVLGLVGPGPAATVVGILVLILLVYLWLGMLIGAHR